MKKFLIIFFVIWASLIMFLLGFSTTHQYEKHNGLIISRKQLKEEKSSFMDMEDYGPIDPVPSSKASIRPGPIEHGSPIIPYIPKPSPPPNPNPNSDHS
ncbi:hypothetical protein G4B88_019050 [Cannabis sativa]|uniref:Uncharacterized protein n=1 Tax=Cannabis sativa TaxID=3483 RepID=A0A7J6H0T0_CANSA|nr:hypothetical protein G4B88_019050 [Cannabis sativa]